LARERPAGVTAWATPAILELAGEGGADRRHQSGEINLVADLRKSRERVGDRDPLRREPGHHALEDGAPRAGMESRHTRENS